MGQPSAQFGSYGSLIDFNPCRLKTRHTGPYNRPYSCSVVVVVVVVNLRLLTLLQSFHTACSLTIWCTVIYLHLSSSRYRATTGNKTTLRELAFDDAVMA